MRLQPVQVNWYLFIGASLGLHALIGMVVGIDVQFKSELHAFAQHPTQLYMIDQQPKVYSPVVTAPQTKIIPYQHSMVQEKSKVNIEKMLDNFELAYENTQETLSLTDSTSPEFALYLQNWQKRVEWFGRLNYPAEAKRRNLHGKLTVLVAIDAAGQLAEAQVLHSSGYKVLDDAAIKIVKLAAPFAPLPASIRQQGKRFEIVRTWQFYKDKTTL